MSCQILLRLVWTASALLNGLPVETSQTFMKSARLSTSEPHLTAMSPLSRLSINGTPAKVRIEVEEILNAFSGSNRLIVGTGDQVGRETPDENIFAMIETVQKHKII